MLLTFAATVFAADFADDTDGAAEGDEAPCISSFGRTTPENGATDVAVNAGLAVEVVQFECAGSGYSLSLYREGNPAPIQDVSGDARTGLLELNPATDLEPFTSYTLRALESTGYIEPSQVTFTTGDSVAAVADWEPTFDSIEASWRALSERLTVTFRVGIPLGQPDYTWVRAGTVDEATDVRFDVIEAVGGFGGATVGFSWSLYAVEMPEESCLAAQGRNVDGSWSAGVAQCVEVELLEEEENPDVNGAIDDQGGAVCAWSTGGLSGLGGLVPAMALFAIRRKR